MARDPKAEEDLKERTLTKLYNAKPEWLLNLHLALDAAVLDAYGWSPDLREKEILQKLLALNTKRPEAKSKGEEEDAFEDEE